MSSSPGRRRFLARRCRRRPLAVPLAFSLLLASSLRPASGAKKGRFQASAPVLTVTLKDPFAQQQRPAAADVSDVASSPDLSSPSSSSGLSLDSTGLSSLSPTLLWSVRSTSPPLPSYLPSLSSLGLAIGYRYDDLRRLPSFLDGNLRFNFKRWGWRTGVLTINPSYAVRGRETGAVMQLGGEGGGWYVLGRVSSKGGGGGGKKKILDVVRASYRRSLPFASVGSVSVTPTHDFVRRESSLIISGDSGTGRTTATLDLNWDDPSLTVVHALDERNTISPEISLYTAKITYNWNLRLDSGSIRARVDPTSAVQVTWTDRSMNGKWVTDFKLPLEGMGSRPSPLAADIRVRRQFTF